jgi:SAM-dependent methyltransferase
MMADSRLFDKRGYPIVGAAHGYGKWAETYEQTVAEGLDRPLLERIRTIEWPSVRRAADLACGTGRTGAWLKDQGVQWIDGVDITPEMLALAQKRGAHENLYTGDVQATPLKSSDYDLCTLVLADEHLADLAPVYREAERLLREDGKFLLVGYHPYFLMNGMPTHFHGEDGSATTIESHVHLFADHFKAGRSAGLTLLEVEECVIDEDWLATKPKWRKHLHWPVSFAFVWQKRS